MKSGVAGGSCHVLAHTQFVNTWRWSVETKSNQYDPKKEEREEEKKEKTILSETFLVKLKNSPSN